jgi:hypothetical protein
MLTAPTMEHLQALKLDTMAAAWTAQQQQADLTALAFDDRFGLLVEAEWGTEASLSFLESGGASPSPEMILRLATVLDLHDRGAGEGVRHHRRDHRAAGAADAGGASRVVTIHRLQGFHRLGARPLAREPTAVAHQWAVGLAACDFLEPRCFEHGCHPPKEVACALDGIPLDDCRAVLDRKIDRSRQQRPGQPPSTHAAADEETHDRPRWTFIERRRSARSREPGVVFARRDGAPPRGHTIDVCKNSGRRAGSIDNPLERAPVRGVRSSSVVRCEPRPGAPAVPSVVSAVHQLREVPPTIGRQRVRLDDGSGWLRHGSGSIHDDRRTTGEEWPRTTDVGVTLVGALVDVARVRNAGHVEVNGVMPEAPPLPELFRGEVGESSCVGPQACDGNKGEIHEQSCQGDRACLQRGEPFPIVVRARACLGLLACFGAGPDTVSPVEVEEGACHGDGVCFFRFGGSIGKNACVGDSACQLSGPGKIGQDACLGDRACFGNPGPIAPGRCVGPSVNGKGVCEKPVG